MNKSASTTQPTHDTPASVIDHRQAMCDDLLATFARLNDDRQDQLLREATLLRGEQELTTESQAPDEPRADWWVTEDPCPSWCDTRLHGTPEPVPVDDRFHYSEGDEVTLSLEVLNFEKDTYFAAVRVFVEQTFRERGSRICLLTQKDGGGDDDQYLTVDEAERLHRILGEQIALARGGSAAVVDTAKGAEAGATTLPCPPWCPDDHDGGVSPSAGNVHQTHRRPIAAVPLGEYVGQEGATVSLEQVENALTDDTLERWRSTVELDLPATPAALSGPEARYLAAALVRAADTLDLQQ